ncbi:MAG: amidohydrolase family protein, partial [Nitriliruptor sp.]
MIRIEATRLIPGRGEPIDDGVVLLDGDTIAYAGPRADAPVEATGGSGTTPVVKVDTVMPGLWDCHVHLFGT